MKYNSRCKTSKDISESLQLAITKTFLKDVHLLSYVTAICQVPD